MTYIIVSVVGVIVGFIIGYIIANNHHSMKQVSKNDGVTQIQIQKK